MEGLTNVKEKNESITIGNGKSLQATKLGDLKCEENQVDGRKFTVTLLNVKYVPDHYMNLFSLNKALQNGLQLSNEDISICLTKGLTTLTFDRIIKTTNGFVTGVKLKVLQPEGILNGIINATISDVYEINYLHKALGHCGLEALMKSAKMYDLETSGKLDVCKDCALAKAQQRNVNKEWINSSTIPAERLYMDISSIERKSVGGAKFWALILDDYTNYCWSFILKSKIRIKRESQDPIN